MKILCTRKQEHIRHSTGGWVRARDQLISHYHTLIALLLATVIQFSSIFKISIFRLSHEFCCNADSWHAHRECRTKWISVASTSTPNNTLAKSASTLRTCFTSHFPNFDNLLHRRVVSNLDGKTFPLFLSKFLCAQIERKNCTPKNVKKHQTNRNLYIASAYYVYGTPLFPRPWPLSTRVLVSFRLAAVFSVPSACECVAVWCKRALCSRLSCGPYFTISSQQFYRTCARK